MKKEKKENNHGLDLCYLYFIRRIKSIKSKDELLLLLYFHNKTTILPIRYFGDIICTVHEPQSVGTCLLSLKMIS